MTTTQTIAAKAAPHLRGFEVNIRHGYDPETERYRVSRAWWSEHPLTGEKPPVAWASKGEA